MCCVYLCLVNFFFVFRMLTRFLHERENLTAVQIAWYKATKKKKTKSHKTEICLCVCVHHHRVWNGAAAIATAEICWLFVCFIYYMLLCIFFHFFLFSSCLPVCLNDCVCVCVCSCGSLFLRECIWTKRNIPNKCLLYAKNVSYPTDRLWECVLFVTCLCFASLFFLCRHEIYFILHKMYLFLLSSILLFYFLSQECSCAF